MLNLFHGASASFPTTTVAASPTAAAPSRLPPPILVTARPSFSILRLADLVQRGPRPVAVSASQVTPRTRAAPGEGPAALLVLLTAVNLGTERPSFSISRCVSHRPPLTRSFLHC
ncbi:hypothetical protein ACK3TF_003777 [Chlorella vulgaris]